MNTSRNKNVGHYSYEMQQKEDPKINPIDLQREIHKGNDSEDSFENQVRIAVKRGESQHEKDFYVVVLFKKERLMRNVVRQYFFTRESCPTPEYDQVVYHYSPQEQKLEFLWVIPDKQSVQDLNMMGHEMPIEQQQLVQYARDFVSGELDKRCAILNKEIA